MLGMSKETNVRPTNFLYFFLFSFNVELTLPADY